MAGNLPSLFDDDVFFPNPGEVKDAAAKQKKSEDSTKHVEKSTEHLTDTAASTNTATRSESVEDSTEKTDTPGGEKEIEKTEPPKQAEAGEKSKSRESTAKKIPTAQIQPKNAEKIPQQESQEKNTQPKQPDVVAPYNKPSLELPETPDKSSGDQNTSGDQNVNGDQGANGDQDANPTESTPAISRSPFVISEVEVITPARKSTKAAANKQTDAEPTAAPEKESKDSSTSFNLPDWKLEKNYYSIGEVAGFFKVNISHIRFWTKEFNLNPRTTRKGDRLYTPEQIGRLRLIHHLVKEKKHTLQGAKELLQSRKENVDRSLQLKDALIALRKTLIRLRNDLG